MPKFIVQRDKGWPVDAEVYPFGETFDSEDSRCAEGVERGYLSEVSAVQPKKERRPRDAAPELTPPPED